MFDKQLQIILQKPLKYISKKLIQYISANKISLVGFLFGILMCISIVINLFNLSIVFLILNRLLDGIDGSLARLSHPTPLGSFIDIVFDFLIYSGFVLSFGIFNENNLLVCSLLLFSYIGTGTTFLARAAIEKKFFFYGQKINYDSKNINKGLFYTSGLVEGTETIIFMLLCLFAPNYFNLFGSLFFFFCLITVVSRIYVCYKELN